MKARKARKKLKGRKTRKKLKARKTRKKGRHLRGKGMESHKHERHVRYVI